MKANVASRIATDTMLVSDLITGIRKGEIKIPQFQRRFVWKDEQALRLLDSIASNYPVGSLLLWRTKDKLASERNIGEFGLPETDDMTPTDYVLDGQQRLTVIYSCLGAPTSQEGFAAAYDLESDTLIRLPDSPKIHQFPLRRMYQTTDLLNYRTALQTLVHPTSIQWHRWLFLARSDHLPHRWSYQKANQHQEFHLLESCNLQRIYIQRR